VKDYAILVLDKNGIILTWNIGAERIKGYKSREIIGKHFTVFYTVEDIATGKPSKILELALRDGRYEEEGARVRNDGSLFFANVIISPMFDENGAHQGFSKITRDITDKKQSDKRLELAATIYQALGEAVLVTDSMNIIIAVNPAMTKLVNMPELQLLNQPVEIIQAKNKRSDFFVTIFEQLDQVGHWQGEAWLNSTDANVSDFNQWGVINNIYDDDGKLIRRVAMFSKITNQKIAEQTIWFQANFDPLTSLPNRNMLQYRLDQAIRKGRRDNTKVAVIAIDLDRFKEVNDSLGHDHGDLLLIEVAARLLACIRHTDCVSRFGGDEFVVVLSEIKELKDVELIAKKITDQLRAIYYLNEESVFISGSIGITISPEDGLDSTLLLKNADQAMYEAKKLGKNRFCYFTTALQEAVTLRLKLINDMKVAMVDNQFRVAYQPIIDFKTNAISKAEALIRWHHPMLGIVNPATFIPIAEESGFICKLDDWVLLQAITQCDAWRKTFHPEFKISVNKSPLEFTDSDHQEPLEGGMMLRVMGDLIVIEITEGVLLKNEAGIHSKLNDLRLLGVEIALDDFGTGYSSLSYLNKFNIDYIKIDQSFVKNLTAGTNDLALCEAIIAVAHKLGIKVIAEGIESEIHYELLKNAGCDYGQGYYISRPVYSDDFELLMVQQNAK
jgi:diguanylate cyclase (GGDEF)-like protein/PAS domain S-box-containing protein